MSSNTPFSTPLNMEIRENLYQKVKGLRFRAGKEMGFILTEPVRSEEDLLNTYEVIKNLSPEDAIEFFGAPTTTNRKNINGLRYRLYADLVRIAVYNEECDDYLKLLSQAYSQPDIKVRKRLILGANGQAKSERLLPAEEITDVSEIRRLLKKRFSSIRGEVGEELAMIESSHIHREEQFVELFNLINTKRNEDLPAIFCDTAEDANVDNYKSKLFKYLINISIFNDECDDTFEQMKQVIAYPKKTENLGYFTVYYGKRYAQEKLRRKSERVLGENNPGHNHGGRYSPFSKKFIKYQEVDESAKESLISDLVEKANVTRDENPQNQPTRIEYYLARGLNEEEARKALSERQSTFSLEKCIEKYGEVDGMEVWAARQRKWIESISKQTVRATFDMIRGKAIGALNRVDDDVLFVVYFIDSPDTEHVKFGITSDIEARKSKICRSLNYVPIDVVFTTAKMNKAEALRLENRLAEILYVHSCAAKGETIGVEDFASLEFIKCDTITKDDVARLWLYVCGEYLDE